MDFHLRTVVDHSTPDHRRPEYAFSSKHPRILVAGNHLLIDHNTATEAIRATFRTVAPIGKIVYVGASSTFLVFLDNGYVLSYVEHLLGLRLAHETKLGGTGRSVFLARGTVSGRFAVYVKSDSPSIWCIAVASDASLSDPFKLRGDIEGDQDNVNFVDGMVAKVRSKVATKEKSRLCPVAAIAVHPSLPITAAAYTNGILRVWDLNRKEQRSYFDAQLLLGERVVQIDLHPHLPVLALCTTLGRVLSFNIKAGTFARGDEPALASSKIRDRRKKFIAMCFTLDTPSYLLLLTASRRILIRMVSNAYVLVNSSRFSRPSRILDRGESQALRNANLDPNSGTNQAHLIPASMSWEPALGLLACTMDQTGRAYIFQRRVDSLPSVNRAVTAGLDTGFSETDGKAIDGPVLVPSDTVVVQSNGLFSYQLGAEQAKFLGRLPPGDVRRVEVARDQFGYCIGALVFFHGDDNVDPRESLQSIQSLRYVLCTRRGHDGAWNVSEPSEGRSGCFLGVEGTHDRIFILSNSGNSASLFFFAGKMSTSGQKVRNNRGVQRCKLLGNRAVKAFRTPFASWSAVLYHDIDERQLKLSKNAFSGPDAAVDGRDMGSLYSMDDGCSVQLFEDEVILDVRWQQLRRKRRYPEYVGAIMTDARIYLVRDLLVPYSRFEFESIARTVAPFGPPSFCWVGPFILLAWGNSLFSVSMDGNADLVAGLSHAENLTVLIAGLPDRAVYARPFAGDDSKSLSVASRPYSALSGLIRGLLALPQPRNQRNVAQLDQIRSILDSHDVSQGSSEIADALIKNEMAPIAYLLIVSDEGKLSMPPMKRAAFLGRMGDIRGAMKVAEAEYAKLAKNESFHEGTELFRLLQRLLNIAFATKDFAVGRRCSVLLGKRGTLTSFIDCEGGLAAVQGLVDAARSSGNQYLLQMMRPLLNKCAASTVASDSSTLATAQDFLDLRRSVQSINPASIPLGTAEKARVLISVPPTEDEEGKLIKSTNEPLETLALRDMSDRLELYPLEIAVQMTESETLDIYGPGPDAFESGPNAQEAQQNLASTGNYRTDLSDEDDIFNTASQGQNPSETVTQSEGTSLVRSSVSNSGSMIPAPLGALPMVEVPDTREEQERQASQVVEKTSSEMHTLALAQRQPQAGTGHVAGPRALTIHERALKKYSASDFSAARAELDMALRSLGRGRDRGSPPAIELLSTIVYYHMACRLRVAMQEIASSSHANTVPGRTTYLQLASALSRLPLRTDHRVESLLLLVDANLLLNNFGSAANGLRAVKELGVPEGTRSTLREKYDLCAARRFTDSVQQPNASLCFMTLKGIGVQGRGSACTSCPAMFAAQAGVALGDDCPCCGIGSVRML